MLKVLVAIIALGVFGYYAYLNFDDAFGTEESKDDGLTACTLEAKVCPDGSAVGRTGPNCEFAACPSE